MKNKEKPDSGLIYYPNRRQWAAVPAGILCIFMGTAGICTAPTAKGVVWCAVLLLMGIAGTAVLIHTAGKTVIFNPSGLVIRQGKWEKSVLWQEYPYLYEARSFRGQKYLIHSRKELDAKAQRKAANRAEFWLETTETVALWDNSTARAKEFLTAVRTQYKTNEQRRVR